MKKYTIIAAMALALLIAGSVAYAQMQGTGQGPGRGMGMGMGTQPGCPLGIGDGMGPGPRMRDGRGRGDGLGLLRFSDELGLSDEQVSRTQTMQTEFRKQMVDDRAALEKAEIDLDVLQRDGAASDAVVKAIDQVGKLKTEMQKKRYLHRGQMMSVLTAEQTAKLQELQQQQRQEMMDRPRGGGQGKGRGQGGMGRGMGFVPTDDDDVDFGSPDESDF